MSEAEVAFYTDEIQALNAAEQDQPGIILLGFAVRSSETPEYIGLLLAACATARIVVIGENTCEDDIVNCLLAGAKGYQNSRQLQDYIGKMIPAIADGEAWVSRKMVAHLLDGIRQREYSSVA